MNIKQLYNDPSDITFESYLKLKGVKDIENYVVPRGKYIENPLLFENIEYAVDEIKYWCLLSEQETVVIYIVVDSDLDGYTSATILYQYLILLCPTLTIKFLIHTSKQRGLDDKAIMDRIENDRPDLVIVPDAGTNNRKQAKQLTEMSIALITLDHHDIEEDKIVQDGYLITNQVGNVDRHGSGCAVTFQFMRAMDFMFDVKYASRFLDMVALSTVSDSMNVTSMQNREYLYWGMMKEGSITNNFLKALMDKFIGKDDFTQRDISFKIVPKFNAVVRTDNMELKQRVIKAMIGMDDVDEVADLCKKAHENQIKTVNSILEEVKEDVDTESSVIVYQSESIPRSYSGLVAGKFLNVFGGKPSIVGSSHDGYMIGSLRSPIPLKDILSKCEYVDFASGHDMSCGVGLKVENIDKLKEHLDSLNLSYSTDTEVLLSSTIKNIPKRLFSEFEPYTTLWGKGLEKPLFHIKPFTINSNTISVLGANKRTLKFSKDGVDFLIFMCTNEQKERLHIGEDKKNCKLSIECVVELGTNEFRGKVTNQCIIVDFEATIKDSKKEVEDIL